MAPIKHLEPPPAAQRDAASFELLRVWIAEQGQHVNLRSGVWEDPFAWGIVLADLARHIVHAESLVRKDLDQDAFFSACWKASKPRSNRPPTTLRDNSRSSIRAWEQRSARSHHSRCYITLATRSSSR
jgi:hypothetical protein